MSSGSLDVGSASALSRRRFEDAGGVAHGGEAEGAGGPGQRMGEPVEAAQEVGDGGLGVFRSPAAPTPIPP